jgi:translation initiation factor 2B subunit (eIF-2B alpha/beta/delta family)
MKKRRFNRILRRIKEVKIQGATNVAKAALKAYNLIPTSSAKKKLLATRPTEPMMSHVLGLADKIPRKEILNHFKEAQDKINKNTIKLIKNNYIIFTHCHSTNVVKALIYAKKQGKTFQIYNTETRPLFQGRKTARKLKRAKIPVTMFVDSALGIALSKEQGTRKPNLVFLGADAILRNGVINKVGSEVIANIARDNKIPVYIIADSWKFARDKIKIEQRNLNEVWNKAPKNIKVKNPAFEFVDKKYITGIVSELGILKFSEFLKRV